MSHIRSKPGLTCRAVGRRLDLTIYGDIIPEIAEDIAKEVRRNPKAAEIHVWLNSRGGDVPASVAIYTMLQDYPGLVITHIDGFAASGAFIIFLAGERRIVAANAWGMIHNVSIATFGGAEALRKSAELADGLDKTIASIIVKHSNLTTEQAPEMMAAETWFNAKDMLAHSLATEISGEQKAAAQFDLSSFSNVPEPVARLFGAARASTSTGENHMPDGIDTGAAPETKTPKLTADELLKIRNQGKQLGMEDAAMDLASQGFTAAEIPEMLIEAYARKAKREQAVQNLIPSGAGLAGYHSGVERKNPVDLMADAMALRDAPHFTEILARHLSSKGFNTVGMSRADIVGAAQHTTSDYPALLGPAANKTLHELIEGMQTPLKQVGIDVPFNDFKEHKSIALGNVALQEVLESGEIKYGTIDEESQSGFLKSYGTITAISFQAATNDDLSAFNTKLRDAAAASTALEGDVLWAALGANMSDGDPVFSSNHSNLQSGAAISATSIGVMNSSMRLQQTVSGNQYIQVNPRFLVVGPTRELVARQVLAPIYAAKSSDVNPFSDMEVLVEPRIGTGTEWFIFSTPQTAPVLRYGTLRGQGGPRVETRDGWTSMGLEFRITHHFGGFAIDYRGGQKNPGA